MFVIDVAFATVGYMLTMKPLDAHIRSATPYAAGWAAALICYPPFILMNTGGPLDYHHGSSDWVYLAAGPPAAAWDCIGAILVGLTAIYAWATIAFGLRFSNLTDRGILTHGPYAFTKHPAYLSKNLFWWIAGFPFLVTTGNPIDAIRNTALLAVVSGIYYWRAKTEEWHLGADANHYRAYAEWMAQYGADHAHAHMAAKGGKPSLRLRRQLNRACIISGKDICACTPARSTACFTVMRESLFGRYRAKRE